MYTYTYYIQLWRICSWYCVVQYMLHWIGLQSCDASDSCSAYIAIDAAIANCTTQTPPRSPHLQSIIIIMPIHRTSSWTTWMYSTASGQEQWYSECNAASPCSAPAPSAKRMPRTSCSKTSSMPVAVPLDSSSAVMPLPSDPIPIPSLDPLVTSFASRD